MFGWEYPPYNSGGLGVACEGVSTALAQSGYPVTFVLPQTFPVSSDIVDFLFADEFPPEAPELSFEQLSGYAKPETIITEASPGLPTEVSMYGLDLLDQVALYAKRAENIARKTEHEVIHAHDWLTYSAAIAAKRISGKPFVAHIHATEIDRSGENVNQVVYDLERQGLHEADHVVAVSAYTKKLITEYYAVDPAKVEVVHNGMNLHLEAHFREGDDEEAEAEVADNNLAAATPQKSVWTLKQQGYGLILFLGRLTMQKGVDYLLRSLSQLVADGEKVMLLVAGKGDMEHQLIEQAASMGVAENIFFVGFLRGKQIDEVYRAADLFVMPSVSEPFGLVALESLAYNTPIIISKQSGVGEVLQTAVQVDFWDTDKLAKEIKKLLDDEDLRKRLVKRSRKQAQVLTWRRAAHKLSNLYKKIVGK